MDFTNEQYIRLYTRDSMTWKRLNWQAKASWALLLRKLDRAGVLELEGLEPVEAVCLATELPPEVVADGFPLLLERGLVEVRGDSIVAPRFLEAQECVKSDKLRAKEYRKRRSEKGTLADKASAQEPSREVTTVTKSDVTVTPRSGFVTTVTPRHAASLSLSMLPLPNLCTAEQDGAEAARASFVRPEPTSPRNAQYRGLGLGKASKLEMLTPEQRQTLQVVAEVTSTRVEYWQSSKPSWIDLVASAGCDEAALVSGLEPDDGVRRIVKKWASDPYVQNNSMGLGHLASNLGAYMTKVAPVQTVSAQTLAKREADAAALRRRISASLMGDAAVQ